MDILVALINGWPDWFRFWFMENSSVPQMLIDLGYTVFEDFSIIPRG